MSVQAFPSYSGTNKNRLADSWNLKKQNNMHYSWPDGIQRLLEEIDNLTHIFSSVSNSNS